MTDNLRLKVSTYHVRVAVPPELRAVLGKYELTKSLKTGNKAEANARKSQVLAVWRKEFERARAQLDSGSKFDFEEKAFNYSKEKDLLEKDTISRILKESMWLDYAHTIEGMLQTQLFFLRSSFEQKQMSKNQYDQLVAHFDKWKANWYKPEYFTQDANGNKTNLEIGQKVQAYSEFTNVFNDLAASEITHNANLKPAETERVKEILVKPISFTPKTPFSDGRLEDFSKHQIEVRKVIQKTVDMQVSRLKTIRDFMTQEKLELNHKSVRTWIETEQSITAKTKKQYVLAGNTFYKWAMNNVPEFEEKFQDIKPPFQNHEFPIARTGKAQKEGKRKKYTKAQVESIYAKAKEMKGKNKQPLLDAIRIGAFTGMRIEEICKLVIERDLIDDEGVYSFSLDDGKNESAIRNIPIHPDLLPLIERLKADSKDGFLMPSPAGNKYGIRSDYLSKAFGRLKTSMGFDDKYVFHSFRGTVITELQRADVPALTIVSIVGHDHGTVTFDIYSDGASAKQKHEAIQKIKYIFE